MSHPLVEPAHVRVALILTWVGMALGLSLLVAVTLIQWSISTVDPSAQVLNGPFDNLAVGALIGLILFSLIVQIGLRLGRGQRRLAAMMIEIRMHRAAAVSHAYVGRAAVSRDCDDTEAITKPRRRRRQVRTLDMAGLSPEIIQTARSLSDRLNRQEN